MKILVTETHDSSLLHKIFTKINIYMFSNNVIASGTHFSCRKFPNYD